MFGIGLGGIGVASGIKQSVPDLSLISAHLSAYWNQSAYPLAFTNSGGTWASSFSHTSLLPAYATKYYVDVATGSDTNNGLTTGTKFKSIWKAHAAATADGGVTSYEIIVTPGRYNRTNGINNSGATNATKPFKISSATPGSKIVTGTFEALTWTSAGSGVWQANRTNVSRVISIDSVNGYGNHPDHTVYADLATLQASSGVNGMAQVGSLIYVKRADGGTVTDANTLCTLIIVGVNLVANCHIKDVEWYGGHATMSGAVACASAGFFCGSKTGNVVFEDSFFGYSGSFSVEACCIGINDWVGLVAFKNCQLAASSWDGINPHWTLGGAVGTYVYVEGCSGRDFGRVATGDSYQPITSHQGIPLVELNGTWGEGRGGTVRFVQASTYLGINVASSNDKGSSGGSPTSPSQFRSDDAGTDMLLIDCVATASPSSNFSLIANNGGRIRYRRLNNTGQFSSVGSTIEAV